MIKECLPKVGIKLLKISYVRILFLVSLLFVAVNNPYSVFLNFQFLNILVIMKSLQCTKVKIYDLGFCPLFNVFHFNDFNNGGFVNVVSSCLSLTEKTPSEHNFFKMISRSLVNDG